MNIPRVRESLMHSAHIKAARNLEFEAIQFKLSDGTRAVALDARKHQVGL
jgi:hypothetical protein